MRVLEDLLYFGGQNPRGPAARSGTRWINRPRKVRTADDAWEEEAEAARSKHTILETSTEEVPVTQDSGRKGGKAARSPHDWLGSASKAQPTLMVSGRLVRCPYAAFSAPMPPQR